MTVFASTTFAEVDSKATEIVALMLTHGLNRIEIGSIHCYEDDLIDNLSKAPAQFLVHNYFPAPKKSFVVNIASPDEQLRQRSIEHILNSITFCAEIGATLYTFHPGFLSDPDGASYSPANYDFRFRPEKLQSDAYKVAFERFIDAVHLITPHARSLGVRVAVESQGSVAQREHVFLQTPDEFDSFLSEVPDSFVGVNLNLGHLNLASNVFGFDRLDLIRRISHRIVAMEVSHNEGKEDEHRPLIEGAWYWSVVSDPELSHVRVILECRDTSIDTVRRIVRRLETERLSSFPIGKSS